MVLTLSTLLGCAPRLPSASVEEVLLTHLGLTAAKAEVHVSVDNPLLVEVPLDGWRWEMTVAGRRLGSGEHDGALSLAANGITDVPIPVEVAYADLWAAGGAAGSDVPYTVAVELDLATPRGPITLPLSHEGRMPRLQPPTLDLVSLQPGLDGSRVTLDVGLSVGLPPGLELEALSWRAKVDDALLGEGAATLGAEGFLHLPLALDAKQAALASWSAAWGEARVLTLQLDGSLSTPLGSVPIALAKEVPLDQQPGLAEPGVPRSPSP